MLGLRTTPKEDFQASSAEIVYGQTLRVPGDSIPDSTIPWSAAHQWAEFNEKAKLFAVVPTSRHGLPHSFTPPSLQAADYVFVHHNAHRGPWRRLYDGPIHVLI